MSKLSMVNGRIVIDGDDASKTNAAAKANAHPFSALREISEARSSKPQLSMVNGKIVMNGDRQAAQPTVPQRRSSNNVMDMAINSLRDRVANSTIGKATVEWASRVSNRVQDIWNEDPAERARRQQRRVDAANLIDQLPDETNATQETPEQARRKQWEINYAQLMDQASSQYEGPTRTETVKTNAYDISNLDAFSNEWNPGEAKEYEYQRTVRNERYNPLSREDRDALIKRYVDVANGDTVDEGAYEQLMYEVTKNGGIEQLLKEQQADEANDREYGRQMRGVNLDSVTLLERLGGTLGGIGSGAGKQIAASGLGLVASDLNRTVERAANNDSVTSYQAAFEQTARLWYNELVNGLDTEEREEQVRRLAAYVGGDAYADAVVNRVRERASSGDHTLTYGLLDGLNPAEGALWENSQKIISDTGIYDAINRLQEGAANDIQRAKDVNLIQGSFGDALVEGAVSAVQNAGDAALAAALGLSGTGIIAMIPFALRAYGGTYAEQMNQATQLGGMVGRDVAKKAAQSAGISSAIEVGTEMMWGMVGSMSKVTGGGALDDAAQQKLADVISGWAKTENGRKILTAIGEKALGGVTEGLEEVIGDAAEQILKNAGIMPGEGMEFSEWVKEAGHSFVTGAIGGLLGEVSNVVATPMQQAQLGKQLKNGGITLSDGTKLTVDDMVNLVNTPGMEGTTLEQTYSSLFKGMPRSTEFSDRELGQLYEAYEETMGRSEEAIDRVQDILGKVENGEELKRSDVNRITNNHDAARYLRSASGTELNLDGNITERKAAVEDALRAFASQNETLRNAMTENLSPNAENANTGDLASRIENLPMINRQAMPAEIARSYFDASVGQTVNDAAGRMGIGEEGRKIMSGLYSGNRENAIDYVGEMTKYYNLGRENKDLNLEDIPANGTVSAEEYQAAWRAGRLDYLAETARKEINNDRAGQEVLVREGTERMDGQNPVGSSAAVGAVAGSSQVGPTGLQQRSAGTERVYSGTQVGAMITENQLNARDMAAAGYNVVTDNNDAEANAVRNEVALKAKKYGINVRDVVLFRGAMANVNGSAERGFFIYHPDGTITIAAQLDNADATGRQIITHEFTHALIKNLTVKLGRDSLGNLSESGESSFGTIRDYMAQELGGQDKLVEAVNGYAAVYKAAGVIAADENGKVSKADMQMVFEEMICDFVAGMNAFSEVGHISQAVRSTPVMAAAKKAVEKLANETRGSPTASEINSGVTARATKEIVDSPVKASISIADAVAERSIAAAKGENKAAVKKAHDDIRNILIPVVKPLMGKMDKNGMPLVPEESSFSPNIFSNGSYGFDAEPTTECYRQMGYRALAKMVTDKLGRPLTNIEAIIVNQAAVEIAIDPPCLYCYSLLDRKAKEAYKIQYLNERDSFEQMFERDYGKDRKALLKDIDKQLNPDINSGSYYSIYLNNGKGTRTDNKDKRARVRLWMEMWANNVKGVSMLDVRNMEAEEATAKHYDEIQNKTVRDFKKRSLKDVQAWVQAASQAKKYIPYSAYTNAGKGNLLSWKQNRIDLLNSEYGLRWYSHADFHPAFAIDNMQQVIDASVRGLKGLMYCKPIAAAKIMAPTGMNINVSCFAQFKDGKYISDDKLGANWDEVKDLRKKYNNVGSVMVVTSDDMLLWALSQDWVDVVIPLHRVRSGSEFIQEFGLSDYTGQQADKADKAKFDEFMAAYAAEHQLTDRQAASAGKKMKSVYPAEHQNDYDTYLKICQERGLTPRFEKIRSEILTGNYSYDGVQLTPAMYMKLVNETRQSESQTQPLQPVFDMDAAKEAVESLKTQGYFEYFKDSSEWNGKRMTLNDWADQAAKDIEAGKKPSELGYGRDLAVNEKGQYIVSSRQAKAEGLSGIHKASMVLTSEYDGYDQPITKNDVADLQTITAAHFNANRKRQEISVNEFTKDDIKKARKWAAIYWNDIREKSPFFRAWFGEWRAHQNDLQKDKVGIAIVPEYVATEQKKQRGSAYNKDTGWDISISSFGEDNTIAHSGKKRLSEFGLSGIREIVNNAILLNTEVHNHHGNSKKQDTIAFNHKLYSLGLRGDGTLGLYRLTIDDMFMNNTRPSEKRFHNLKYIEKIADIPADALPGYTSSGGSTVGPTAIDYTISDLFNLVKRYDSEFVSAHAVSSDLLNDDGTPKVLYHQTGADIEEFSNENPGAGKNDSETPNGFFAKDNDHDIGLDGKKQMSIYMTMQNPLHFANREEANAWYCKNVSGYKALQDEMQSKLKPIDQEMNRIENEMFKVDGEEYDKLEAEWDKKHKEMGNVEDEYRGKLRGLLDDYFLTGKSAYDGIILDYDGHRYVDGRRENVKTYIAFKNTQIKSASDNIGTFDKTGRIRFSRDLSSMMPENADETAKKVVENLSRKSKLNDMAAKYGSFKSAAYTDERIAQEIEYSYATGERSKDYARAYIAFVSPGDFIDATSSRSWRGNLYQQVADKAKEEGRESMLDLDALQNERQSMFLRIEATEDGRASIVGHEGRHRMIGLEKEGYKYVPVIIEPREGAYPDGQGRYSTKPIDMLWLNGQEFSAGNGTSFVLHDILPLSANYADIAKEIFAGGQNVTKFSRDLSNRSSSELYEANRQLQKDLNELRSKLKTRTEQYKYWKGQTKVTEGRQLRIDDVTRLAREIIKGQESSADAKSVAEKMKALGEYILNTMDENVYDEARLKAYEIAHEILSNAKVLNEQGGEHFYKDFRAALKQTPIYVTPSVREEVSPDGWNGLRQMAKGIFTPTADKSKGKTVDVIYHDLQSTFGEWLLPEYVTSEADQLNKIFEVVETYQPVYENINSYDMADAVEWTANEILTRIVGEEIRETNPTYADRMEKKLSDQKVKSQEALRRVREQRDRKVQNLKEHYQQVAEDRRNRKIDSEMRTRLLNIAKRLNNKKLDRVQRALLDKYIGDLDLVSKSLTGRTIHDLEYLKTFYEAYKERMGEDFIPDKFIEKKIDRLNKKHISDMTQEEVADLTTVLLNLETLIRTENKLIDSQIKADIYAAGSQTIDDVNNSNGKDTFLSKAIGAETATPERYLHRITGYRENSPLYQAAKELSDGQRKMLDYQMRAESLFLKWTRDKKFTRRIAGKHAEEITISGRVNGEMTDVKITPAMRMALYLHEQNDDNMRHISQGGVKIPNMELYKKGKLQEAYDKGVRVVLTRGQVREIVSHMSAEERAFANAVSAYYNGMSRNEINDTSEKLRGYAIAGVEKYYPIDSDGAFLRKEFDQLKRDGTLEGMGILKERIEGASNAIMLYDMNDTLNRSISQHSKYVGLAIPVRNFNRLYGVTTFKDKAPNYNQNAFDSTWEYDTSVIETIQKNWGSTATNYISKMMTDLQNGTGLKDDFWGGLLAKARSHYAGAVLTTNLSVAMKQAASYPTAAAVVGYGPLIKAFADRGKVDLDTLAKYTPLLWYRSKGFVDPELGDIGKEGIHIPKALNWIQGMDVATTTKLVKAAMIYVNENQQGLVRNTDAWWKAVAEVYNRIIEETQPNYTMMQRPQILRSDNALTRALNMFKTQPFQNFNILYDAFGNLSAKSREYKANTTQENLQALKSARANVARAVSSQVVSAFVFALMQFAWDAFRGKAKKYKDDDEEMTFASWLKGMGINVLSSFGGMIPFGSYALELGEAMTDAVLKGFKLDPFFDQTFYGLSENAAESMNDMGNALISIVTKTTKALQGEATTETTIRGLVDGAADIAQFAGMPVSNVIKLAQSIARNVFLATDGQYLGGYKALRVTTDPAKYKSDYYALLKKAWENDQSAFEEIKKRMIEMPGDPFATAKKTAAENIEAKVKDWIKEKAEQSEAKQTFYGTVYDEMTANSLWDKAPDEAKDKALEKLLSLALEMGVEGSDKNGAKYKADIEGGKSIGLDATEYMLYQVALQMSDADGNGTIKQSEAEAAVKMLSGLSAEEKAYLFQTTNKGWKNNPFK